LAPTWLAAELELDGLEDRLVDAVEIMVALADLAGGEWPERTRSALLSIATGTADAVADASLGLRLLDDLRTVTAELGGERFATESLLERLNALDESPWGGFHDGRGLSARDLARRLKPYGIRSGTVRLAGDATAKGYKLEDLADAFGRYMAAEPSQAPQASSHAGLSGFADPTHATSVTDGKSAINPHGSADVADVSAKPPLLRPEDA
jgi:hypothetical protein